jgi:hypothetical protein
MGAARVIDSLLQTIRRRYIENNSSGLSWIQANLDYSSKPTEPSRRWKSDQSGAVPTVAIRALPGICHAERT